MLFWSACRQFGATMAEAPPDKHKVTKVAHDETCGCVVVSTFALHVLSSRPRQDMGMFGKKTWLATLGTVHPLSHGDVKEPLRTTCTLAVTTLAVTALAVTTLAVTTLSTSI